MAKLGTAAGVDPLIAVRLRIDHIQPQVLIEYLGLLLLLRLVRLLLRRLLLQDAWLARVHDVDYLRRLVGDSGRVSRCLVFGHAFDSARILH